MKYCRRDAYSAVRLIVVLTVLGFVVFAAWKSLTQLSQQQHSIAQAIATVEAQLAESAQNRPDSTKSALSQQLISLQSAQLHWRNFDPLYLFLAFLCYGFAILFSAVYWHHCLAAFGHPAPLRLTLPAHVLGQLGKYVPGKAMVVVIRSTTLKRHTGIPLLPSSAAVFVETLTMMASGGAIAGVLILFIPVPLWLRLLALGLTLAAAVPTIPPLFRPILGAIEARRLRRLTPSSSIPDSPNHADCSSVASSSSPTNFPSTGRPYGWKLMAIGWIWMTLVWILIGTSFWLVIRSTPGQSLFAWSWGTWSASLATISLAVVAGFVSLIPGGAGVREAVIAVVLAPVIGAGSAVVAAILTRLLFLIVEAIAGILATMFLKYCHPPQPNSRA